jgi:hypothetical protein
MTSVVSILVEKEKFMRLLALAGVTLALLISSRVASATTITYQFNETGNGLSGGAPLSGSPQVDPISGVTTLAYHIGFGLFNGDVRIFELGQLSDVLRFVDSTLYVFSDLESLESNPPLADVGLPTSFQSNVVNMTEVGPESGPNGVVYTPSLGQPGYSGESSSIFSYDFQSDPASAVPLPAGVWAGSALMGALGLGKWRSARNELKVA